MEWQSWQFWNPHVVRILELPRKNQDDKIFEDRLLGLGHSTSTIEIYINILISKIIWNLESLLIPNLNWNIYLKPLVGFWVETLKSWQNGLTFGQVFILYKINSWPKVNPFCQDFKNYIYFDSENGFRSLFWFLCWLSLYELVYYVLLVKIRHKC